MAEQESFRLEERYAILARRVSRRDPGLSFEEYSDFVFLAVYRMCAVKYTSQYQGSILMAIESLTRRWKEQTIAPLFIESADRLIANLAEAGKDERAYDALYLLEDFAFDAGDLAAAEHFLDRALDIYDKSLTSDERERRSLVHKNLEIDRQFMLNKRRAASAAPGPCIPPECERAMKMDLSNIAEISDELFEAIGNSEELDGLVD